MASSQPSLKLMMERQFDYEQRLDRDFNIRDDRDLAEFLIAEITKGIVLGRQTKDYDVDSPKRGKITVKHRRRRRVGQTERRLHCKNLRENRFDWLAATIFERDYSVTRAILVSHNVAWRIIKSCSDPERKICIDDFTNDPNMEDVTPAVALAVNRPR
jgi:hypothetical protein